MDLVCHARHGIPVYIVKQQYILLRPKEVDLELFFEDVLREKEMSATTLSPDFVKDTLESLDSSWDRKVLKVALGNNLSKKTQIEMGIGSRVFNYEDQVFETIEAKKKAKQEAESNVMIDLQGKIKKAEKNLLNTKKKLKKENVWSRTQLEELKKHIEDWKTEKKYWISLQVVRMTRV